MPAITTLRMYTAVAALAQRDQIIPRMCTALRKRYDVMHLLDRHDNPTLETFLAERMLLHVGRSDSRPGSPVPTAYSRISVVLLVACVLLFLMFLAVPSVSQVGTPRPRTWSLRLIRHSFHLLPITKAPRGFAPVRLVSFCFSLL